MVQNATASSEIHIVDDDAAVRDALAVVLTLEGYHVSGFADGHSFLAAVRSQAPACVILDVHMPGRSGLDILKELNAKNYPAPVFIISGQGDIPMAVEAIKNGAFDFIEKPFDAETVVNRVREAIEATARQQSPQRAGRFLGPVSRERSPDQPRTGSAQPHRRRRLQQGGRTPARHQPPHHRGPSRPHHGEAGRQERRRPRPHCPVGNTRNVIAARGTQIDLSAFYFG